MAANKERSEKIDRLISTIEAKFGSIENYVNSLNDSIDEEDDEDELDGDKAASKAKKRDSLKLNKK